MPKVIDVNILAICFVSAFLLIWPATWLFRQLAPRIGLIDVPNVRSSHIGSIPVAGGAIFVVLVLWLP